MFNQLLIISLIVAVMCKADQQTVLPPTTIAPKVTTTPLAPTKIVEEMIEEKSIPVSFVQPFMPLVTSFV